MPPSPIGPLKALFISTTFLTLSLFLYPEDGDIMFIRNVGNDLPDYFVSSQKILIFFTLLLKRWTRVLRESWGEKEWRKVE
jgi:hypothetical protein